MLNAALLRSPTVLGASVALRAGDATRTTASPGPSDGSTRNAAAATATAGGAGALEARATYAASLFIGDGNTAIPCWDRDGVSSAQDEEAKDKGQRG